MHLVPEYPCPAVTIPPEVREGQSQKGCAWPVSGRRHQHRGQVVDHYLMNFGQLAVAHQRIDAMVQS